MELAIDVKNLTKHYKDFALKNISFELPKGSIMGFIGENGAGKTTTINAMLGVILKDGGEVSLLGKNPVSEPNVKEDVAVVFDELCFTSTLNATDISMILKNSHNKFDKTLYMNYLKEFNLPFKKAVKDFSKGMKMKLSLACALSRNPKLLILDEATSGLDPIAREEVLDLLLTFIQDEERSIFFSSHITSDLDKIADYITFIHNGELVFSKNRIDIAEDYGQISIPQAEMSTIDNNFIKRFRSNSFGADVLIQNRNEFSKKYPKMQISNVDTEQIMLYFARGKKLNND